METIWITSAAQVSAIGMQVDLCTELALKITLPLMQTYKNSGHLLAHFVKQPCET